MRIAAVISSLLLLFGCVSMSETKSPIQKQFEVYNEEILKVSRKAIDIPKYPSGDYYFLWVLTKEQERQLRLPNIENSNSDILIRIWKYDQKYLRQPNYMFQIEKMNGDVKAIFYGLDDYLNPKTYYLEILQSASKEYTKYDPKEVLSDFLERGLDKVLTDEQLPGYPMEKIHEKKDKMFGIEVATSSTYRFYQYSDPRELGEKFNEAKALYAFLTNYVVY